MGCRYCGDLCDWQYNWRALYGAEQQCEAALDNARWPAYLGGELRVGKAGLGLENKVPIVGVVMGHQVL